MYEDRTFEKIMEEMMNDTSDQFDKQEGSLLWNACAKNAVMLEAAYADIEYIWEQLLPDTQDREYLAGNGAEAGVLIRDATAGIFKAQFNIPVEAGERFSHSEEEWNYYVTEVMDDENHIYKMECEEVGSEPNNFLGELEPVELLEGFEKGVLLEVLEPGEDEEDTEEYRQRRLEFFGIKPFAGNRAYYEQELKDIEGVGGVKIDRRKQGEEIIKATIISGSFRRPEESFIADVQEMVDPIDLSGEGDGIAPIEHKVRVLGVEEVVIDVETKIVPETGYTIADLQSYIEETVSKYLNALAENWENTNQLNVVKTKIEAGIIDVLGVADVSYTKINGAMQNVLLGENAIPVKGVVKVV
ncbi:baseplate J/gp47 family protein [Anaerovorax odorimutans]|uniref:Baseplate J/gp47 family protein n=1 Tax=Anaerovorax odorimutans TaxID=109327 RepID=A0ABT1RR39_9FIRM|nr:baseplate J/gp47 family protein [Anaerovorax odorimutans]MCQ4637664.1 baseplate J/gp47 family protein [Anaerovorax odorimutans]